MLIKRKFLSTIIALLLLCLYTNFINTSFAQPALFSSSFISQSIIPALQRLYYHQILSNSWMATLSAPFSEKAELFSGNSAEQMGLGGHGPQLSPKRGSLRDFNSLLQQFEAYTRKTIQEWNLPGAAVAIVWNNRTVLLQCYGHREVGKPELIDEHTIFRLGSLSKTFTSELTGIFQQKGLVDWDDPVINYLPNFKLKTEENTKKTTIRHLLDHSGGLFCFYAYDNLIEDNLPYASIFKRLNEIDIKAPPGKSFTYQNILFSVTGTILENVTRQSFPDLLEKNIFIPLRMYDSSATEKAFLSATNRATPHIKINSEWKKASLLSPYYQVAPASGINSSIANMVAWLHAQMGLFPEVISPSILAEVHKPQINTSMPSNFQKVTSLPEQRISSTAYGLGWRSMRYQNTPVIFHGGHVKGYTNILGFIPKENVGIVILTNSSSPVPTILMSKFFDLYLGLPQIDWSTLALSQTAPKKTIEVAQQ